MKKILISTGILLAAFAVVGLFTKDQLALAFFGTIAGLFALMTFWAVKYYVEARRMGIKPSERKAIPEEFDKSRDASTSFLRGKNSWRFDDK